MKFDAKEGVFMLFSTSKGAGMETDMLAGIELPYPSRLQEMKRQISSVELDLWDRDAAGPILEEIVQTMNSEGAYSDDFAVPNRMTTMPIVSYSPLSFLRKTSGRIWYKELENAIEKMKGGILFRIR